MKKIAINNCYGGFGLSDAAMDLYLTKKGLTFTKENEDCRVCTIFSLEDGSYFDDCSINRDDPTLIEVIEELGEKKASGRCAKLYIEEIRNGTPWRISEYDGYEKLETLDNIDWNT